MGLTRALLPLLVAAPDASVVFTLDNRGEEPRAYWGGYAVTKAGVATLARELADEWENRAEPARQRGRARPDPLAAARADASGRGPRRRCRRRKRWCRSTCISSPARPKPRAAR